MDERGIVLFPTTRRMGSRRFTLVRCRYYRVLSPRVDSPSWSCFLEVERLPPARCFRDIAELLEEPGKPPERPLGRCVAQRVGRIVVHFHEETIDARSAGGTGNGRDQFPQAARRALPGGTDL